MRKIEIGKVWNSAAWNENFQAEISDFYIFVCGTEIITSNPNQGRPYIFDVFSSTSRAGSPRF